MKVTINKEVRKDNKEIWVEQCHGSPTIANYECFCVSEIEVIECLEEYVTNLSHEIHTVSLLLNDMWLACPEEPEAEKASTGGEDK